MKNKWILFSLLFCLACKQQKKPHAQNANGQTVETTTDSKDYEQLKKEIGQAQQQLKMQFAKATSTAQKKSVQKSAFQFFEQKITTDITNQWLGTTWDFNGITQTPRSGDIACGYFVSTVLRDAGYAVNRVKYAQCASQIMIQYLCDQAAIKTFSNATMETVINHIHSQGKGLYVTGLDFHTGFIYNDGQEIFFIHSLYIKRVGVVKQKIADANVFVQSKYKMIGKLSQAKFLDRWLK